MRSYLYVLFFLHIIALPSQTLQAQKEQFEFLAKTVKTNNKIDDEFNKLSSEGWEPIYVLEDEERMRLIFTRSQDASLHNTGIKYRAETVGKKREIDDKMNELAADNWAPLFVIEDLIRYRIIFGRDSNATEQPKEYLAEIVEESRYLDDKFNQLGVDGWQPLFALNDAERFRIIFGRTKSDQSIPKKYRAVKVLYPREIDDKFNELALEGWKPVLGFPDGIEYRLIFVEDTGSTLTEYMADKVTYSRHIEDMFVQHSLDGWFPRFVFRFSEDTTLLSEEPQYRLLFSR